MENKTTEIVFVLDRSGSMGGLESDTIGGFNGLLQKQKTEAEKAYVTTVLFDHEIEILHDHLDIQDVNKLTEDDYYARGCTALLDAVGSTIKKMERIVKHSNSEKVIFVIITDGLENASREYNKRQIKNLINEHQEKGWKFMFLGANIDAFAAAEDIGISKKMSANYVNSSQGVDNNFKFLGRMVSSVRKAKTNKEVEACCECCMESLEESFRENK